MSLSIENFIMMKLYDCKSVSKRNKERYPTYLSVMNEHQPVFHPWSLICIKRGCKLTKLVTPTLESLLLIAGAKLTFDTTFEGSMKSWISQTWYLWRTRVVWKLTLVCLCLVLSGVVEISELLKVKLHGSSQLRQNSGMYITALDP